MYNFDDLAVHEPELGSKAKKTGDKSVGFKILHLQGLEELCSFFWHFLCPLQLSDDPSNVEEHITGLNVEIKNLKMLLEKQAHVRKELS